jgi:hypothetical protein
LGNKQHQEKIKQKRTVTKTKKKWKTPGSDPRASDLDSFTFHFFITLFLIFFCASCFPFTPFTNSVVACVSARPCPPLCPHLQKLSILLAHLPPRSTPISAQRNLGLSPSTYVQFIYPPAEAAAASGPHRSFDERLQVPTCSVPGLPESA